MTNIKHIFQILHKSNCKKMIKKRFEFQFIYIEDFSMHTKVQFNHFNSNYLQLLTRCLEIHSVIRIQEEIKSFQSTRQQFKDKKNFLLFYNVPHIFDLNLKKYFLPEITWKQDKNVSQQRINGKTAINTLTSIHQRLSLGNRRKRNASLKKTKNHQYEKKKLNKTQPRMWRTKKKQKDFSWREKHNTRNE